MSTMTISTLTSTDTATDRARARPTRISVQPSGRGVVVEALDRGDFLAPRLLDVDGRRVRIALVGCCAMLVAGDQLELDVEVGAGVEVELVEPSGTVAYNARGASASWAARATVATGGLLSWQAAPLVVAAGADLTRTITIDLAEGSRALFSEVVVLGRSGEVGGALRSGQHVTYASIPLLVEELDLTDAALRACPGILGRHRVVGTVAVFGHRPETLPGPTATYLAGPGALVRVLSHAAHTIENEMHEVWQAWRL
ncbi:urease accessory protein UreD [Nocardia sp. NPDC058633]|uniref:urease accessory protein UreD n=1 Tax=Nocardia sp. NPDC058633 TaxID=3346568 RepID=UPI00364EA5AC